MDSGLIDLFCELEQAQSDLADAKKKVQDSRFNLIKCVFANIKADRIHPMDFTRMFSINYRGFTRERRNHGSKDQR